MLSVGAPASSEDVTRDFPSLSSYSSKTQWCHLSPRLKTCLSARSKICEHVAIVRSAFIRYNPINLYIYINQCPKCQMV